MVGNPKMVSPHIKASCGTQTKNPNPMGIRLGIDYVTWWEILRWTPPTSKPRVGHKKNIPILCHMVGNPKMDPLHIKT